MLSDPGGLNVACAVRTLQVEQGFFLLQAVFHRVAVAPIPLGCELMA